MAILAPVNGGSRDSRKEIRIIRRDTNVVGGGMAEGVALQVERHVDIDLLLLQALKELRKVMRARGHGRGAVSPNPPAACDELAFRFEARCLKLFDIHWGGSGGDSMRDADGEDCIVV